LYEKDHPYMLLGPGIELDLSQSVFEQHTDSTVKVSGSRVKVPDIYTIKLEGAAHVAFRTIVIAGVRDPLFIERIDEITQGVVAQTRDYYSEIPQSEYQILFRIYGRDGVMGPLEPCADVGHEVGVLMEVVATTQELANVICAQARSTLLHYPYPGRKSTAGNLAFPYSPSDIPCGPVYRFTVYHLVEVDSPGELFETEYRTLQ
jgi:hypothetical protein